MGFVSWRRGWLRNIHRGWNYGTWQVKFNFVTCGLLWSAQTGLWGTGCGFFFIYQTIANTDQKRERRFYSLSLHEKLISAQTSRTWRSGAGRMCQMSYSPTTTCTTFTYLFDWLIDCSVCKASQSGATQGDVCLSACLSSESQTHFLYRTWRIASKLKSEKSCGGRKVISRQLMNAPVQNELCTQTTRQKVKERKRTV